MKSAERLTASTQRMLKENAKKLRRSQTRAERLLWDRLKHDQLGVRFRRQHRIGRFIVDFYCAEIRAVVELDGRSHLNLNQADADIERDETLRSQGIRVVRFLNEEVFRDLDRVVQSIQVELGLVLG